MNDRELLEMAAKAAGYEWRGISSTGKPMLQHPPTGEQFYAPTEWNPLADDGDALRLAVKLRLVLHIWDNGEHASAAKTLPDGGDPPSEDDSLWSSADAHASGGLAAATRRAIVLSAAAIAPKPVEGGEV